MRFFDSYLKIQSQLIVNMFFLKFGQQQVSVGNFIWFCVTFFLALVHFYFVLSFSLLRICLASLDYTLLISHMHILHWIQFSEIIHVPLNIEMDFVWVQTNIYIQALCNGQGPTALEKLSKAPDKIRCLSGVLITL